MRRGIWIGAALSIAVVAAIPLWLVLDEGGVRRLGAIDAESSGQAGQLTLAGVNGGAPIPIDSFAFQVRRPVGATQAEESIEVTLPLGTSMTQLVSRAALGSKAATGKVELVRTNNNTLTAYLTLNLTNVSVEGYDDSYSTNSSGGVSKAATYKLGAAAVTSLAISDSGQETTVVAELSSPHFGVTTYSYTAAGVLDKSPTVCLPSCTGL
jgi:type VI protein secretion system component Hcp